MTVSASDKKISRRTIVTSVIAVALILIIVFAYFAPQLMKPSAPSTSTSKEKVLVVGTSDYLWGIDPYDMRGYIGHMMNYLIYDTLVSVAWTNSGWVMKPSLAISWQPVDGKGAVWEFELRKDVFFHDGTPFNATAVKFTMDRTVKGNRGDSGDFVRQFKSVEVVNDFRVRVTLKAPFAGAANLMLLSVAAPVSPTAVNKYGVKYSTESLAGTGPFKLERWAPDDQIVLVKNDKYWDKDRIPKIDRFILKFFKDPSTLKLALEKGEIDVVHRFLLTSDIPAIQANPAFSVYKNQEVFVRILDVNPRPTAPAGKYLSNMLVRQAIAYAIDYDRIISARGGQRVYGPLVPGQMILNVTAQPQRDFKYDPDKAKQLLAQAGYPNGIPQTLEYLVDTDRYGAEEVETASIIKSNLEAIGIHINLRLVDAVLDTTLVNAGNSTLGGFSMTPLTPDPDTMVGVQYYSTGTSAALRFGFNRTDVDQMVLQARAELDPAKREQLYIKLQMDCDGTALPRGQIYLWRPWNYAVAWKYVKGDLTPTLVQRYSIDWTQIDIDPSHKIS